MPHLAQIDWNSMDQLRRVDLGGGGTAYYVYGTGGQRQRKVIERNGNINLEWIFLGPVMIFRRRRRDTDELRFERWTVHISDSTGQIAQVDTKTRDVDNSDPVNPLNVALIRYQYTNHLGSAVLETDDIGNVISYEEYHPYGTTAYRSSKPGFDLSLKRYRFSGKERDDETGLHYFGARYYASWLGRWTSSDPGGFVDGLNLFYYARNNPIMLSDPDGFAAVDRSQLTEVNEFYFTGKETLEELKAIPVPEGKIFNPFMTEKNYRDDFYLPGDGEDGAGGIWALWVDPRIESGGQSAGIELEPPPDFSIEEEPPPADSAETPDSDIEETPVAEAARRTLEEAAAPRNLRGEKARGTARIWSGGKAKSIVDAMVRGGDGFTLRNINGHAGTEHVAARKAERIVKAGNPKAWLTKVQMDRIWGWNSFKFVFKAAFSGFAVESAGPASKIFGQTGYIKGKFEILARRLGGATSGALMIGSGLLTAYVGSKDENPYVATSQLTAGVGEALYGAVYAGAQWVGKANIAKHAAKGGRFFGGAGAFIGFGVESIRAFDRGDNTGGWINAVGAFGGALLLVSAFTPVGPLVFLGTALILGATGANIFRALRS
jgi:RHS repeat-associated protein